MDTISGDGESQALNDTMLTKTNASLKKTATKKPSKAKKAHRKMLK